MSDFLGPKCATTTDLNLKAPIASPTFTGTVAGVTKSMVGLANVDNTADAAKPVSTAQQTALDTKFPIAYRFEDGTLGAVTVQTGTAGIATPEARSGNYSVLLTSNSTTTDSTLLFPEFPVEEGRTYRISSYGKLGTGTGHSLRMGGSYIAPDGAATFVSTLGGTVLNSTGYTLVTRDVTIPNRGAGIPGYKSFKPRITSQNARVVDYSFYIDDITFVDITDVIILASATVNGLMLAADKTKLDNAVSAATVSRLVIRDAAGRAQFVDPSVAADAATKNYVDVADALKAPIASPTFTGTVAGVTKSMVGLGSVDNTADVAKPVATGGANGLMSAADKTKLDNAASTATASRLAIRDASGRLAVADPAATGDAATKNYVDVAVNAAKTQVNVKDYGALGDGTTDDYAAVKNALAAVPVGGTLYFPPGTYYTAYKDPTVAANWLTIDKNGVTLTANPGAVTLDNFLIYVKGTYGSALNIAANMTTGDDTMTTTTAHSLVVGDYVQMLSAINSYTPDGGDWTLGSSSPTDSSQPIARYAEIHKVELVNSTTSVKFSDLVVYPGYNIDTTGQTVPISGVTRAHYRKLTPVKDVTFQGIKFRNIGATANFRCIQARATVNLRFDGCLFESGPLAGALFKASDCYNTSFTDCSSNRNLDTLSGSSWNTFFIGGGCHGTLFDNCTFVGEAQTIDFTPNNFNTTSDIGGSFDSAGSWLTCQFVKVTNSTFRNCSDGVTSHPGTYMFEFKGNTVDGGSVGVRARSRASIITGNLIYTSRTGVVLGAFPHDSLVADNQITQIGSAAYAAWWDGVNYAPVGSETMNLNDVRMVIKDNTLRVTVPYTSNAGVRLFHNVVTGYAPYTDDIKNNRSQIEVSGNTFYGCSVVVEKWINGTLIQGNTFRGGSDRANYIQCDDDSAANSIQRNHFMDATVVQIRTGAVTLTGHGYTTSHRVGIQSSDALLSTSLANTADSYALGSGVMFDGLNLSSSAAIRAIRTAGTATLNLDAKATDGTSGVFVDVFNGNTTTGAKLMRVFGQQRAESFRVGTSAGPQILSGSGTPEAVVTAEVGSLYLNVAGGASTTLYVKTSGTGNTGWVAK